MKTFEEIMSGVTDHIHYARSASQLTSLALTKFAKQISKKGAKILCCSPKLIKLNDGTISEWGDVYSSINKPTLSELGAAPAVHTHNYLPLAGGTLTGNVFVNKNGNPYYGL